MLPSSKKKIIVEKPHELIKQSKYSIMFKIHVLFCVTNFKDDEIQY